MSTSLVLGLGESGLAMARWLARDGGEVVVWDSREAPPRADDLARHVPGATRLAGTLEASALDGVERVAKSPGLAPADARIAALLAEAARRKVPIVGELDLFGAALASLRASTGYAPHVLAITGTNGKTTTTAMTALVVGRSGKRVVAAGNIGPTTLQSLADAIDAGAPDALLSRLPEVWVLELSSFQLHDATAFEPTVGALLNLSDDHLDWHGSLAAYAQAKARVFGRDAALVVNRDDAAVMSLLPPPRTLPTRKGRAPKVVHRRVASFGAGRPQQAGDWGLVVENDVAWLARARDDVEPGELVVQSLMPTDALRVRGRHNALNALAALALGHAAGCALAPMLHALAGYRGEPHRVELVATVGGIDAFDDSKGTNVGATVAALVGLGAERAPGKLVVILGGDGKGQDFAPLAAPLVRVARAAILIGRDAAAIERAIAPALGEAAIAIEHAATLDEAVDLGFARAEPGDALLLSPACASLDMFRHYAHRAEVFVAAVQRHAEAAEASGRDGGRPARSSSFESDDASGACKLATAGEFA